MLSLRHPTLLYAVLDTRIMTKNNGSFFLKSIPTCKITDDREEFGRFFEGLKLR